MKLVENIKFSTEKPYRLVPLPEKLCIFHCSVEELWFSMENFNFGKNHENNKVSN